MDALTPHLPGAVCGTPRRRGWPRPPGDGLGLGIGEVDGETGDALQRWAVHRLAARRACPAFTNQHVADAKARACAAYTAVRTRVSLQTHASGPLTPSPPRR